MTRRLLLLGAVLATLFVIASPATALIRPASTLPDGDTAPVVNSAELLSPARHNELLEADLLIDATDDMGIARYEYRWNRGTFGQIVATSAWLPKVSYASILPDTEYALQVRAIDVHGWPSGWVTAWSGITPSAPNVIVAGDSIASGYQRQWFTGDASCRNSGYSYGSSVAAGVADALPDAWAPTYVNVAAPGAGVGSVFSGGTDSCSQAFPSQVDEITRFTDPTTWNVVVMTAGINSTNWGDVVMELTKNTAFSFTDRGDKAACRDAVENDWNIDEKAPYITERAADISTALADTNADLYWTSYYDIVDSRLAPGWSPVGHECADEMDLAMAQLHSAIQAGLDDDVHWVDLLDADVDLQQWAGWPHPNPEGHHTIGAAVAEAITG